VKKSENGPRRGDTNDSSKAPAPRGIGWKSETNACYHPFLEKKALYELRGHGEYRAEREKAIAAVPTFDLDGQRHPLGHYDHLDDVVLHAHIFGGSWDWYVAAYDPSYDIAYGFVSGLECEWGQFYLREVETEKLPARLVIGGREVLIPEAYYPEVEVFWTPITFRELKRRCPQLDHRGVA
jgi:hypothetical protein